MRDDKTNPDVSKIIDEYFDKSDDELMSTVREAVREQKRDGTFDPNALNSFREMLSPILSDDQQKRFDAIILALKE